MPTEKRIDWTEIRLEYVAGGIGQRKLAKKYGVPETTLISRAQKERWAEEREKARNEILTKSLQKTAEAAADNAAVAQSIKAKLLKRLEREIDNLPETQIGSTAFSTTERTDIDRKTGKPVKKKSGIEYKLRELAGAYKDLTSDMLPTSEADSDLLTGIFDVLNRRRDESD